jgi:hypothetical protein
MLTFSSTILLMCVRARNKVRDANITEKGIKLFIFTTSITLHGKDFSIKYPLNKSLKLSKVFEHLRFILKQIDPRKLTIVINETNIIFHPTKGINGKSPHI